MNEFLRKYGNILIGSVLLYSFFQIYGFLDNKKSGIIRSDGLGYYSYLPAMFIYGDYTQSFLEKAYADNYKDGSIPEYMQTVNDRLVDKYFFGVAVLVYPFFILAHILSLIFGQVPDGYSVFYQYFVGFAAIFYVFLGCLFISRLLKHYISGAGTILLINLSMVFGTNLFHYTVIEPSMSHAYSFSMVAGFLFFTKEFIENQKPKYLFAIFITLALVTLIRPVNALLILIVPFLAGSPLVFLNNLKTLLKEYKVTVPAALIAAGIVSLQCVLWYMQTGKWIVYAYTYERFHFDKPEILNVLFSYRKGLFIWTPLLFISLTGLIYLFLKKKFAFLSIVFFLCLLIFIVSSWYMWYYGMSFGFRPLIDFFPVFAILLALGFNLLKSKVAKTSMVILCLGCIYINQVQAYQYRHYILHWSVMSKEKYWKVFLKTDDKWKGYLWENLVAGDIEGSTKASFKMDFESQSIHWNTQGRKESGANAYSGNYVAELSPTDEFGPTFSLRNDSALSSLRKAVLNCSFYIYDDQVRSPDSTFLVVSLRGKDARDYFYQLKSIGRDPEERGKWRKKSYALQLGSVNDPGDELLVYFWNPQKNKLLIDDIEIELVEEK